MEIIYDDGRYEQISHTFLRAYITAVIRVVDRSEFLSFDFTKLTDDERGFIFEICFNGLIELEAARPLDVGGIDHFCHTTFSTKRLNPDELISSQTRTWFHGAQLDEVLDEIIQQMAGQ